MLNQNNSKICGEIHWWEFPLTDFSVKFDDSFKNEFFNKIYSKRNESLEFANHMNDVSKKYNKNWNFKKQRALIWEYKSHTEFIPAWFIYEVVTYLKIDLLLIEKKIIEYITFGGKSRIYKPKLPVKITPEFTAIAIHVMCDGHLTPNENFLYAQKDSNNVTRFVSIVNNIFGAYEATDSQRKDGVPTTYTPKIFAKIISNYYGIETYLSSKCQTK